MHNIIIELINSLSAVKDLSELDCYHFETEELLMRQVLTILMDNQDIACCSFFILNEEGYLTNLTGLSFSEFSNKSLVKEKSIIFKVGEGIIGLTAQTGKLQQCNNTQDDDRFYSKKTGSTAPLSILSIPVFVNNHIIGVLNFSHPEANHFTDLHIRTLEVIKNILGQLMAKYRLFKQMDEKIKHRTHELEVSLKKIEGLKNHYQSMSMLDPLTGLYNRRYFYEHADVALAKTKRYGESICLFMIDLDYFKRVNDDYGHIFGDQALIKVADVLRCAVRGTDVLARFGGEEFIILTSGEPSDNNFIFADRIRAKVEAVIWEENPDFHQTVSIGFYCFREGDEIELNINQLIHHADTALYQAKKLGRNRVIKFTN